MLDRNALIFGAFSLLLLTVTAPSEAYGFTDNAADDYRKARDLLAEDPAAAFQQARTLPKLDPVDDRRRNLLARAALRTGHPKVARRTLKSLYDPSDPSVESFWAGLNLAELALLGSEVDEAAGYVDDLREQQSSLDARPATERYFGSRLLRLRHDIALARQQREEAQRHALELKTRYPASEAARRAGLTKTDPLDKADQYRRAKNLYGAWSYKKAREAFEKLRGPPPYDDNARWYLGHIALNKLRDRPKEAEQLFDSLTSGSPYAAEALYNKARARMTQERYADALETLDAYARKYPGGRRIESVYYYRGWLPYDHRNNEKAVDGFTAYIDRYGKSSGRSSYVYGFLAWTYMRMGKWKKAIETYDEMESFGNMLVWGKALYWQAHAWRQLEKPKKALERLDRLRKRYPVTYYAVLGEQMRARINGTDARASEIWWPAGSGEADDRPRLSVTSYDYGYLSSSTRRPWERAQALVRLGERAQARNALSPIYDDLLEEVDRSDRDEWIHAMGHYIGDYHRMWAVSAGTIRALPQMPEPDSLTAVMAYPRAYRDIVQPVAEEFDIPTYLMYAIMRQESRYRPAQVSHADAVGALQMIPQTARKVADDLGTTYNPRTFHRPEVGFRFSGYYMKKLLKTFDGHFVPMATAYNSGPTVVAHWYDENPDASFPWLIEEFAYNEGRNYGRKVAEHMVRYLYLYEDDEEKRNRILNALFPLSRDITIPEDVGY